MLQLVELIAAVLAYAIALATLDQLACRIERNLLTKEAIGTRVPRPRLIALPFIVCEGSAATGLALLTMRPLYPALSLLLLLCVRAWLVERTDRGRLFVVSQVVRSAGTVLIFAFPSVAIYLDRFLRLH